MDGTMDHEVIQRLTAVETRLVDLDGRVEKMDKRLETYMSTMNSISVRLSKYGITFVIIPIFTFVIGILVGYLRP
jgi:hypothetical protein